MARNKISKDKFNKWASESWQIYASETLRTGVQPLLRFYVSFNHEYKIECGGHILYQGFDFDEAKRIYENKW